jgi:hypothetical protein
MLDLEVVVNTSSYTLDVLRALAADNLDNLCFVDFPARHGYAALDALYPKRAKYGQRNPPASEIENWCGSETASRRAQHCAAQARLGCLRGIFLFQTIEKRECRRTQHKSHLGSTFTFERVSPCGK